MVREFSVLSGGWSLPEAPTWFDGSLWVSDLVDGGIARLDSAGAVSERRLEGRRGIGGLVATADGRLLASGRDLVDSGSGATVLHRPAGCTGFNDLGVDRDGNLLIGVLTYRPLAGDDPAPGSVARWDGCTVEWNWGRPFIWPNGIDTTPEGTTVVADFATGQLLSRSSTALEGLFVPICSSPRGRYDGVCLTEDGTIWAATGPGGTIEHRTADGTLLATIEVPASFVSSVAFHAEHERFLIVTAAGCTLTDDEGGAVLIVEVDTTGRPPRPAQLSRG